MSLYTMLRPIARLIYRILYRVEVVGKENIPETGGVLLCCNHSSYIDPPTIAMPLDRRVRFMAKEELFRIPLFASLIRSLGAFPVKRGAVTPSTIRTASALLSEGEMVCVFPQGTRSRTDFRGKKGAAVLALRSQAMIVPMAIIGSYKPFGKLKIVYGEPFSPEATAEHTTPEQLTEQIMQAIVDLITKHQ